MPLRAGGSTPERMAPHVPRQCGRWPCWPPTCSCQALPLGLCLASLLTLRDHHEAGILIPFHKVETNQRGSTPGPRSHSQQAIEPGVQPRQEQAPGPVLLTLPPTAFMRSLFKSQLRHPIASASVSPLLKELKAPGPGSAAGLMMLSWGASLVPAESGRGTFKISPHQHLSSVSSLPPRMCFHCYFFHFSLLRHMVFPGPIWPGNFPRMSSLTTLCCFLIVLLPKFLPD